MSKRLRKKAVQRKPTARRGNVQRGRDNSIEEKPTKNRPKKDALKDEKLERPKKKRGQVKAAGGKSTDNTVLAGGRGTIKKAGTRGRGTAGDNTPTISGTGILKPADLAALREALGQLKNPDSSPKTPLPDLTAKLPKGAFVERLDLLPKGVENARAVFDTLKADIPVLLFPVRLETRFSKSLTQLRIRIFPDQASIDALDPRLTAEEFAAGKTFLTELKRANDQDQRLAFWRSFATAYAPRRAAHIVRTIRAGGAEKDLREPGDSHRALAPLLPDHWFVTGYAKSQVAFDKASVRISPDIAFSPDLSVMSDVSNDLAIDPALKWMIDYNEAVRRGMAVTVNLPTWAREKIDEIYVLGVRTSDAKASSGTLTPRKAAGKLNNILEAHLHDWGAGFAAPATATNNTSDVAAGWSDATVDLDDMFTRLIDESAKTPAAANPSLTASSDETMTATGALDASGSPNQTNHARLETAVGLPANTVLKKFENRTGSEDAIQAAMNTLLWPVTLGEMLGPLLKGREETILEKSTSDWLRNWFIDHVRGGAPLPTLRLGRTPYGVLPVSKTHLRREMRLTDDESQRQQLLGTRLRSLLPFWETAAEDVLRMGPSDSHMADQFPDPGDRFLQILRQQPNPAKFSYARAVSERSLFDLRYEIRNLIVHPDHSSQLLDRVFEQVEVPKDLFSSHMVDPPGKAEYFDWPARFDDGEHQREKLTQKQQILRDMRTHSSYLYDWASSQTVAENFIEMYITPRDADIDALIGYLQDMIDICVDHIEANANFDATIDPPHDLYSGKVGYSSDDPHLTYLSFNSPLTDWDSKAHVVVSKGPDTVGFAEQVDFLLGYSQSFISSAAVPAEPTFPDGKKPLLFQLLKEAIYRTGVDEETSTIPFFEMTEVATRSGVPLTSRQADIGGIVGAMEVRDITDLTASIRSISKLTRTAPVKSKDERVARTLRGSSAKTLTTLAQTIDRDIAANKKQTTYPVKEMSALSAELKSMGKAGDGKLKGLTFSAVPNPRRQKINQLKNALTLLRNLNPDQIELLMSQTLGLASWRLDAWLTSLPLRRIADLRAGNKRNGIQVGAFGWVQNLQPNNRDAGDGNRVRSQGFIHTPSLNHAKTAAVLRAGWTNYGSSEATSPMAVDLASGRMRDADWIFTAVRRGQDLGDLLGYRFERYLKDTARGAHWIYPIRQAVLALTGQPLDPEQPGVDGLELNRIVSTGKSDKLKDKAITALKELGGADKRETYGKVDDALSYLSAQVDALADAAIADSVHALVQGNLLRSGSSLSAISDGEVPPPELEILRTTPAAQTQTHRLALLAPLASDAQAWVPEASFYPCSAADPDAEALVAALLGPPDQLRFTVSYYDETGAGLARTELSWAEMLAARSPFAAPALQTLMLLPADGLTENSDLLQRVLAHAAVFPPRSLPAGATARVEPDLQDQDALAALMDRWLGWRAVVLDARPMAPRDILMGEDGEDVAIQLADLEKRAQAALTLLEKQATLILRALPEPEEGNETPLGTLAPQKLMAAFDILVQLGMEQAVFRQATGVIDNEACYLYAWQLAPTLRKKMKETAAITFDKTATPEVRVKSARAALKLVFGAKFPGLCRLTSSTLPALSESLDRSDARAQKTTGGMPAQWIEKLGYVRPSMRAMNDAMLIQDCQPGSPGGVTLKTAQWPEDDLHPWIAVDGSHTDSPPKTSLVAAFVAGTAPIGREITGLVVDEVVDRVPATSVNTGVALHFDAPNTEAPQTLLLALPPVGEQWSYATLIDTVRDAFQLARIRAVDGHLQNDMNQFLPAIFASKATYGGGAS